MPLLVIPLAPDEVERLTLAEWDDLRSRARVFFERPDHPLVERLRTEGVDAGPFDDVPRVDEDSWALVADPGSPRVVELARRGANVSAGAAESPDDLTAAHGAFIGRRASSALARLALVMARLRSPDGCPWDREQTHESLRVHLLEEAYEVLDSIDRGEVGAELEEELGDVLLQVVFHSQLAAQEDRFDVAEVADRIVAKLLHRHPHVFGDVTVADADEVVRNWEEIKVGEKRRSGRLDDLPLALPSLLLAYKAQKRAAAVGFTADADDARRKLAEILASDGDLGEALFWLVAVARARGIDPEGALRRATLEFRDRLRPPHPR